MTEILRKVVRVEIDPDEGPALVTMECGHATKWSQSDSYQMPMVSPCWRCNHPEDTNDAA